MEKNLGHATAYGYAKSKGYSGTEDEFAELMADYASVGQSAAQSAEQAAASATSASASAQTASQAAQTATSKASEAVTAAGTATTKASEASQSASTASAAATSASTSAQTATTAADTATGKASEASESATTATTAKTDAESARDAAAQSASQAAASAESIDPDEFDRKIYAAFATDTATGAIASFADGADNIPMKDVLVHVDPVQDLHGYDSPWPAGGGKQLLNPSDFNSFPQTINGITVNLNTDGSFTLNGTASNTTFIEIISYRTLSAYGFFEPDVSYTLSGYANEVAVAFGVYGSGTDYWSTDASGKTMQFTAEQISSLQYRIFIRVANGATCSNVVVKPMICKTSATNPTQFAPYSNICPITGWTGATISHSGADMTNPTTYDITFPTEAGTVYGGTLDVTKGELVVDRAMVDLGTLTGWRHINNPASALSDTYLFVTNISDAKMVFNGLLSKYKWTGNYIYFTDDCSAGYIYTSSIAIRDDRYTDVESFQSAMSGVQFVYELATPITYQLTPQEITSLLGTNNLWADTGDTEVEYRADTEMYITKKITEVVSALS